MKRLAFFGLFASLSLALAAQTFVSGYVYEDANRNGKRDKHERGIPQTAVSNGTEVVATDAAGRYRLPVDDDRIIFVIKPSGYQAAVDSFNLPRLYYIHKPAGSPNRFYPGVKPTGKLPASVDFALHRDSDESETFSALIFGDTQTYNEREVDYLLRGIVAEAKNTPDVRFGITLGDLVGDRLDLHLPYKQTIRQLNLPWYNVMGNHDMNYDAGEDRLSDETFESNFGPNNYAFNYGKAHFIVLDDILYPHPLTGKGYWGGLRDDQLAFVKNDLALVPHDHLVVISMHIPLFDPEDSAAFRDADRQALYALLKDYPQALFLSAHTHIQTQEIIGSKRGLDRLVPIHEYNVGTACGDWYSGIIDSRGLPLATMRDGTPAGYALLRIKGNRYTLDYQSANHPADYQIGLYHPKVVPFRQSTSAALYANFFMGGPEDSLEYRIDNDAWLPMRRVDEPDPAYIRAVQDWDYLEHLVAGRRPSNPVVCTHLWKSKLPTTLPVGEHRIEVRAKDRFQRTHIATSVYRVEEAVTN